MHRTKVRLPSTRTERRRLTQRRLAEHLARPFVGDETFLLLEKVSPRELFAVCFQLDERRTEFQLLQQLDEVLAVARHFFVHSLTRESSNTTGVAPILTLFEHRRVR